VHDALIGEIKNWLKTCRGESEPCAVIHLKKGKTNLIPINNVSKDPNNYFLLDPIQFSKLSLTGEILYVVHGHPEDCTPSEYDIRCCDSVNIPYLIFNRFNFNYTLVTPKNYKTLSGRFYKFGESDCFEAARDWYAAHNIYLSPRKDWMDDWWLSGYDYLKNISDSWPFNPVSTLQYGDLLTFAVESDIENHIGVYIDKDCFFHHAVNRISCKENLYPFWAKHLKKVYRYEGSNIERIYWG